MIDIDVLTVADCPSQHLVEQRLREALRVLGQQAHVRSHEVRTPEEAERRGFRGSPTVLLDGEDLFPEGGTGSGLACRVYATAHGLEGAPSVDQLVDALRRGTGR